MQILLQQCRTVIQFQYTNVFRKMGVKFIEVMVYSKCFTL